jgi:hypothetical protein
MFSTNYHQLASYLSISSVGETSDILVLTNCSSCNVHAPVDARCLQDPCRFRCNSSEISAILVAL